MKKLAPVAFAAATVLLVGAYVLVRSRPHSADPLPRWSCNYTRPPVNDVPAELLTRAGFRDSAELQRFVEKNEAALRWTYFAVQSAIRTAEQDALKCFAQRRPKRTATAEPASTEARLVWHLSSDGAMAVAERFEIAGLSGAAYLAGPASTCLKEHVMGRRFVAGRTSDHDLIRYRGVFPFHRKIRFSATGTDETLQMSMPSTPPT